MSQELAKSFRVGHQAIIDAIDQVLLYLRSYTQAKPKLRELNKIVLNHLGRQDEEFYIQLKKCDPDNREQQKILEYLIHDLKDIKIQYITFFEKHSGEFGDSNSRNFPKNFQDFIREVIQRIKTEEDYLLPLVEKLPGNNE